MADNIAQKFITNAKLKVGKSTLNSNVPKTVHERIEKFTEVRTAQKIKEKTIREDVIKIKIFFEWLENYNITYDEIDTEVFYDFFRYLNDIRENAMSTQERYLNALKVFFRVFDNPVMITWLKDNEATYRQKSDSRHYDALDYHTVELIQAEFAKTLNETTAIKYMLFLRMIFETGGRLSEVLNLKVGDVSNDGTVILRITKTSKHRIVSIDQKETLELFKYFCRFKKQDDYIFTATNPIKPMTESYFREHYNKAVKKLKKEGKIPKNKRIVIHSLRHGQISSLLDKNLAPDEVMEYAGHRNLKTTLQYAHSQERLKKKLPKIQNSFYNDTSLAKK